MLLSLLFVKTLTLPPSRSLILSTDTLPSVSIAVEAVTNSLNKLAPRYIRFPTDQPTVVANKLSFHAAAGFPNVLGAIDGTHIAIKAPSNHEEAFVNRKGVHTINVQAVCDNDMRILNLVAK